MNSLWNETNPNILQQTVFRFPKKKNTGSSVSYVYSNNASECEPVNQGSTGGPLLAFSLSTSFTSIMSALLCSLLAPGNVGYPATLK